MSLVFGIPTIRREKMSYLLDTLASLLDGMSQESKDDSVIVVFIGEVKLVNNYNNILLLLCLPSSFISSALGFPKGELTTSKTMFPLPLKIP